MASVKKKLPDVAYLRQVFDYDKDTGELTWKERPIHHFATMKAWAVINAKCAGKEAGYKHSDERGKPTAIHVRLNGVLYKAHRICWVLAGNVLPSDDMHIDHINGNPHDNRICNLRVATSAENLWNRGHQSSNTRGLKGVTLDRRKKTKPWLAQIHANGKQYRLGSFFTKGEAALAYLKAAMRLHQNFARIA